jgi:hypothetical protein
MNGNGNTPAKLPLWAAGLLGSLILSFLGLTVSNVGRISGVEARHDGIEKRLDLIERHLERLTTTLERKLDLLVRRPIP